MSSRCNVASCSNDRRYKDRWLVLPHVQELKFHRPRESEYLKWQNKLDRTDYHVSANTRVCSNHFKYGKPIHSNHIPSFYLRSYPSWASPASQVKTELTNVSDDIICEALAHVSQYLHNRDMETVNACLAENGAENVQSVQELSSTSFDMDISIARILIQHVVQLVPVGKCVECVALFKYGAQIEGVKHVKKPASIMSGASMVSASTSDSENHLPSFNLHDFHSYCSTDSADVPETDHSYFAMDTHQPVDTMQTDFTSKQHRTTKTCRKASCRRKIHRLEERVTSLEKEVKSLKMKVNLRTRQRNEKQQKINIMQNEASKLLINPKPSAKKPRISINMLKDSDSLIALHTGLANYSLFKWVFDEVSEVASKMTYWSDSGVDRDDSVNLMRHGPAKTVTKEDELLICLMKLKLNLSGDYLAFLFGLSRSTISNIISTWIPMLGKELAGLIYWPSREEVKSCYPQCFKRWPGITAILDCFEITTERPSHVEANSQIFSSYKNRTTSKFLLACTPGGSVSYISPAAGGNMSDKEMVMKCEIPQKFSPGDKCMVDKGFRIEGELLEHGVQLIIPPFVRKGKPFTDEDNLNNKHVAHARIHVERVIGRVRDYTYLNSTIPVNQLDLISPAVRVCCALTNIKKSVVTNS